MFGGVVHLAEVRVQEGEPLENALRRFKRKVQQEDIIKEVKRHSFYLKPGERRRVSGIVKKQEKSRINPAMLAYRVVKYAVGRQSCSLQRICEKRLLGTISPLIPVFGECEDSC
jgi:small subunit ribosomal protein S21